MITFYGVTDIGREWGLKTAPILYRSIRLLPLRVLVTFHVTFLYVRLIDVPLGRTGILPRGFFMPSRLLDGLKHDPNQSAA
jgi:hypothetical protein